MVPVSLAQLVETNVYYMQGSGFESRTLHFSMFKICELQPLGYLTKQNKKSLFNTPRAPVNKALKL